MPGLALGAIAALIIVNGFFVAAEFALVSSRRARLAGPDMRTRLAQKQLGTLDEYLSACQLGITIASLALGALGEPTIAHLLEPVLDSTFLAHFAAATASVLAILVMTALHITIGEQAPKSFAIGSAESVARACAVPLELFYRTLRPLVVVLNNASNAIVRLFGGTPASSHGSHPSLDELRHLIRGIADAGGIDATDEQILRGVFTLDERRAYDVMTPRTRVTAVRVDQTVREALESVRGAGHSRWPLLDQAGYPLGVIYSRELTDALLDGNESALVETFRHDVLTVPGTVKLDDLLTRLRSNRASICAIVGEFGELEGVVSIEDIVEEVVGEIWDEDDLPDEITRLPRGGLIAPGDTSLTDFAAHGIVIRSRSASTIGGLVQERLDRPPVDGERMTIDGVGIRVIAVEAGRVKSVALTPVPTETG